MRISIIGILAILATAAMSQPVTKSEETTASKRATILTEVEIPDSESEASENKEKRGAARLTSVSSNSLQSERPSHNQLQNQQVSDIAQLTQLPPQAAQQIFAPHPYSFVLPYPQPKITYSHAKTPYLLPQQPQHQILQLPAFSPQHQQYMLIIPPQQSPAQHQLLMLIAPAPTANGFHYIAQPNAAQSGLPPQHLINFYAGQPQQFQQQTQIQQREPSLLHGIPQQPQQLQQPIHVPNNQQQIQQHSSSRIVYSQEHPQVTYQTVQEHTPVLLSSQPLVPKLQQHQQQIQHQHLQQHHQVQQHQQQLQQQSQQQQQQYLLEEGVPTPSALVSTYGSRLHSQPSHQQQQQQQQYKTIIKV